MKRGLIYGLIIAGVLVAGLRRCDRAVDDRISTPVLTPDENAKVILDPRRHTITTVKRGANGNSDARRSYLPPNTTSVTVDRKGEVHVNTRMGGTGFAPFIGFAYSDKARLILGVGLLYYRAWEGNLAIANSYSGPFSLQLAATVSYNVYSNTSLFAGVTHTRSPIVGITFRF